MLFNLPWMLKFLLLLCNNVFGCSLEPSVDLPPVKPMYGTHAERSNSVNLLWGPGICIFKRQPGDSNMEPDYLILHRLWDLSMASAEKQVMPYVQDKWGSRSHLCSFLTSSRSHWHFCRFETVCMGLTEEIIFPYICIADKGLGLQLSVSFSQQPH